jgi:hypothetical protein
MSEFAGLSIKGRVATQSDPDWDDARRSLNLVLQHHGLPGE